MENESVAVVDAPPSSTASSVPEYFNRDEQDLAEGRARIDEETGTIVSIGPTTWGPVDLTQVLLGMKRPLEPAYLKRSDGRALIYPGAPHIFYGESESLKSWAAFLAAKSFLDDGLTVLYIDFEGNDVSFVERARHVGVPDEKIGTAFVYVRPDEPLYTLNRFDNTLKPNDDAVYKLQWLTSTLRPSLAVIDGVTEAYSLHGWNINDATHAAHFQHVFSFDAASIAIDHAGKDAERGQIGSQHKRAGLDGSQYEFKPLKREGRGGHSIATIRVTKDRHGSVREFAPDGHIGTIHVADTVWIAAPTASDLDPELAKKRRIVEWVGVNPGQSASKVIAGAGLMRSTGFELLRSMVVDGYLVAEPGPRNATYYTVGEAEVLRAEDAPDV